MATSGGEVLNGTYQVTACSTPTGSDCAPAAGLAPASVGIAVAPAVPAGLSAAGAGGSAKLTWKRGAEVDLTGYVVQRSGKTTWGCSVVAGGSPACPVPPAFNDQPGAGSFSYGVIAQRYGVDADPSHLVDSPPAITQAVIGGSSGTAPPPVQIELPAIPYFGPVPTLPPVNPPPGKAGAALPDSGYSGSLPYDPGSASGALAGTSGPQEDGPGYRARNAWASVAGGMLVLALALHLWYLRDEATRYRRPRHLRRG